MKFKLYKHDGRTEVRTDVYLHNADEIISFLKENEELTPTSQVYTEVYLHIGDIIQLHNGEIAFDYGFKKSSLDKLERP